MSSEPSSEPSSGPSSGPGRSPSPAVDDLPPALASMWRVFRLGYSHEPGLMLAAFAITVLAALPDSLQALWLKLLADGVGAGAPATIAVAAGAMAVSAALSWLLRVLNGRVTRRFRDKITIALETHIARLQASVPTLEHHERADYLDRLAVLRNQVFVLDHMYASVLTTIGWVVRLGVTVGLLAGIHPVLVLLVVFAVPTVLSSARRPAVERAVEERQAPHSRLAEHLFATATTAEAAKEVRLSGIGERLVRRRRAEWERWFGPVSRARWTTAISYAVAWAIFGLAFAAAVIFVAVGLRGSVGSVLLILAAGARLSAYIGEAINEIGFLRGVWLDGSRRLVWLERFVAGLNEHADQPAPQRLRTGIELRHVTFRYPGADRLVLDDVSLSLPAGSVVALVGENGAGKSTLIKLLTKMYEPTSGVIMVDDTELSRIRTEEWRTRLAGAFQDFFRFEFSAQRSVGLGDLPELENAGPVEAAVHRTGADDVLARLPDGLRSQLGATWPDGQELSFGQWQKIALSRGSMRRNPLLTVLDEPTAALDAETEHELFERYAEVARARSQPPETGPGRRRNTEPGPVGPRAGSGRSGSGSGDGITILVSHRFSTVRMADLIVVLDGSRLVQLGSHQALMGEPGPYAELYRIQARAYRG